MKIIHVYNYKSLTTKIQIAHKLIVSHGNLHKIFKKAKGQKSYSGTRLKSNQTRHI